MASASAPLARLSARSIVSFGMFAASALSMPTRRRPLLAGSAPVRAAIVISRMSLVKILPRRASSAFLRPAMLGPLPMMHLYIRWSGKVYARRCDGAALLLPLQGEGRDRDGVRCGE